MYYINLGVNFGDILINDDENAIVNTNQEIKSIKIFCLHNNYRCYWRCLCYIDGIRQNFIYDFILAENHHPHISTNLAIKVEFVENIWSLTLRYTYPENME